VASSRWQWLCPIHPHFLFSKHAVSLHLNSQLFQFFNDESWRCLFSSSFSFCGFYIVMWSAGTTRVFAKSKLTLLVIYWLWLRLDKTKFHIIGAVLFTVQQGLLHPTAVVKTRMQVADSGLSHMGGISVAKHILRNDGIPGLFRGFGTSAIGALPGRVLSLTALEVHWSFRYAWSNTCWYCKWSCRHVVKSSFLCVLCALGCGM
jgi:hypothetical protein